MGVVPNNLFGPSNLAQVESRSQENDLTKFPISERDSNTFNFGSSGIEFNELLKLIAEFEDAMAYLQTTLST